MRPGEIPHVWCSRCERPVTWQRAAYVPGERAWRVTVQCHGEASETAIADSDLEGFEIIGAIAFQPGVPAAVLVKEVTTC